MRGKVHDTNWSDVHVGITPAHAGKSVYYDAALIWYEDHPRACGEKPADYVGYKLAQGSPPRMRGKGGL